MPDYQTPNVIGPELVTNGTFDTDLTGWTDASVGTGGPAVWNSGAADLPRIDGANLARLATSVSSTTGSVYLITFDRSGSNGFYRIGTSSGANNLVADTAFRAASNSVVYVASTSGFWITFYSNANGGTLTIDNISVREIDPLAVSIYMRGEHSWADSDNTSGGDGTFYDWGASDLIRLYLQTGASPIQVALQQKAGGVDEFPLRSGVYSPQQNMPFAVASRSGSNFAQMAAEGTASTEDTTPVAIPDLSAADFQIGTNFNGTIEAIRVFAGDVGDTGLEELTT